MQGIAEADSHLSPSPREKLEAIAGFIVESYRHEPELMKVIVVEVTRAANTFGRTHLAKIREAYEQIARHRGRGPRPTGSSGPRSRPSSGRSPSTGSIDRF